MIHGALFVLFYLLSQHTNIDLVIPFTSVGVTNTSGLRFDAGTHVHGLAALERGHVECDTARAGESDLTWRASSEVPIERGPWGATRVGTTGYGLAALECVTVGKSSRAA